MTKNSISNEHMTVTVVSQDGENIGFTYPRRAAGLVKKGRARYVNDNLIRLESVSDALNTEDIKMDNITNVSSNEIPAEAMNRIYFDPRQWNFNPDCPKNVGSRSFMTGPDGSICEAFTIGDWGYNWTEICSKPMKLPKNMLNVITFWLNGGENDNQNEVCRFEVRLDGDYENRYTYNLNRSFIPPVKRVNGWELYEIPFRTEDNEDTQLFFVAQRAYMTVLPAKDAAAYSDVEDTVDEFEGKRPQRHNIIFGTDGWPLNTWYSTAELKKAAMAGGNAGQNNMRQIASDMQSLWAEPEKDLRTELIDLVLEEKTLPASSINSLVNGLFTSDGEYNGKVFDGLINSTAYTMTEQQRMLLIKMKVKFQRMVEAFAKSGRTGSEKLGAMSDFAGQLGNALNELVNIPDEIQEALRDSIETVISERGSENLDSDSIAYMVMERFPQQISQITEELGEMLDDISQGFDQNG